MVQRIWNLRLNLDEFNAIYGSAFTDSDKAMMLSGMFVGMNGGAIPEDSSKILRGVFEMCSRMREEAESFSRRKSEGGKNSAESRKLKYGSAQPPRSDLEDTSEESSEESSEVISNQSTILNPLTNNLTNDKPEPKTSASRKPRRSLKEKLESLDGYSDEATRIIRACVEFWPEDNGESRKLREDPFAAAARVDEILEAHNIDGDLLIGSARRYIEKMRGSGSTKFIKCLHFFFGPGKPGTRPTWMDEVKALNHERKNMPERTALPGVGQGGAPVPN